MSDAGVLIVGASIAGVTVAETLRSEGYDGRITLIGDEPNPPYVRPPLSKQVLSGDWSVDEATIHDAAGLESLHIDFRPGEAATNLDLAARVVETTRGRHPFTRLVIATGASPRPMRGVEESAPVLSLRTIDDAAALRSHLQAGRSLTIIGGGVLGCEVASAARKAGCEVTMLCLEPGPTIGRAGSVLSDGVAALLREGGVDLRVEAEVVGVAGVDGALRTLVADGTVVASEVVLSAIGCIPNTAWLARSGLDTTNGVLCDAIGQAADGVYAVGDVARWTHPVTGEARRVEHQLTAIEQAQTVAAHIATGRIGDPIAPFFWTELFGTRILVHGTPDPAAEITVLHGSVDDGKFVAAAVSEGRPHALIGWNMPRELRQERAKMLASAMTPDAIGA
jgi:NADPH-dependent 2,4-dienoyl-CoA reductase/sulfur reductase-like enzyme